jgi:hypothetical protein
MSAELQWAVIRKSSSFLRTNKVGSRNVFSTVRAAVAVSGVLSCGPIRAPPPWMGLGSGWFFFSGRTPRGLPRRTAGLTRPSFSCSRGLQESGNLKNTNSFKFNGLVNKKVRPPSFF